MVPGVIVRCASCCVTKPHVSTLHKPKHKRLTPRGRGSGNGKVGVFCVNLPNLVQVPPEIHCGRVLAETRQVPPQEHLASLDFRCLFVEIILVGLGLVDCCSCVEGPRCDVILEKLFIYQVDYCRDQLLDVFVAGQECFDIAWENVSGCGLTL